MYDAWAAYDDKAVGTRLGGKLRRPPAERTPANKEKAIAYATYRALLYLFPEDEKWIAAQAREARHRPGQRVHRPGHRRRASATRPPRRSSRTAAATAPTSTATRSGPTASRTPTGPSTAASTPPSRLVDPDCWQPIPFDDGKGGHGHARVPHAALVPGQAVRPRAQRPVPPRPAAEVRVRAAQARRWTRCSRFNATLTPEQKAIVEFMRDGPRSTGQSGHWLRFAQDVSRRDQHDLDQDVKLFFAVGNVAMDAFIAAGRPSGYYDSSRPWTLVRHLYAGQDGQGLGRARQGRRRHRRPRTGTRTRRRRSSPRRSPATCPGTARVSGACAKMLELFTGSDTFGEVEQRKAGDLTEPGFACEIMQSDRRQAASDQKLTCDVALKLPTFTATAEMAGISRVMGGYHIQADNVDGLKLGRKVAEYDWPKIKAYFDGTAGGR